ncbi:MAG: YWFCY domain-containing protein [Segetibacter sp.]
MLKVEKIKNIKYKTAFSYTVAGLLIYFFSYLLLLLNLQVKTSAMLYISVTVAGFI